MCVCTHPACNAHILHPWAHPHTFLGWNREMSCFIKCFSFPILGQKAGIIYPSFPCLPSTDVLLRVLIQSQMEINPIFSSQERKFYSPGISLFPTGKTSGIQGTFSTEPFSIDGAEANMTVLGMGIFLSLHFQGWSHFNMCLPTVIN